MSFNTISLFGLTIALVLPLVIVLMVLPVWVNPYLDENASNWLGLAAMWAITGLLYAYIRRYENRGLSSIGLKKITFKQVLLAAATGVLCSLFIPLFYYLMNEIFNSGENTLEEISDKPALLVLFGVITAAVTEETLVRAYPLERIQQLTNNNWPGIITSLAVFTALHFQSWDLLHIFGVVLPLGITLTLLYLKFRNLLFLIIVHLIIDLPLFFMAL